MKILKQIKFLSFTFLLSFSAIVACSLHKLSLATADIHYQMYRQPTSIVHVVTVYHFSERHILPKVMAELTNIEKLAEKSRAIVAINGGYFDPANQKTTSYITRDTVLVADPRTNERLIDNPDLQPYLGKILDRAEFRRYSCDGTIKYDIALRSAAIPDNCILQDALGAGPQLLPEDNSVAEGFTAYQNGKLIRNAIGGDVPNARSAVAITPQQDIILAMVEQRKPDNSGMSLADLATFLKSLGATEAMNLDGGSSSSLYYRGKTYYGKLDKEGNAVQRPLKSVLLVNGTSP